MGPLFNGMTIASERNVWAAGQNALEYANKFPQSPPTTPPFPTTTPTPEDGGCPDTCPDDKNAPAPKPTPEEEEIEDALNDILNKLREIEDAAADAEKSVDDYLAAHPELSDAIDKLKSFVDFSKHVGEADDLLATLGITGLAGVGVGLLILAALYLGDWALGKVSEWFTNAVNAEEDDLLNGAIDYLKENFIVADAPFPATRYHTIGHAPTDIEALLNHLVITYMMGGDKIPTLANKADQGQICSGSPNVYFGGQPVARVSDVVDCDFHCPSKIAQGSATVFANGQPIARVGNKTTCNGVIKQGVTSIFIDKAIDDKPLYVDQGYAPIWLDLAAILSQLFPPEMAAKDAGDSVSKGLGKIIENTVEGDGSDEAGS